MLLGEVIGASRRCASDWPTEMVNDNELESAAKEFADGPAAQPPLAVSGARRAIDTVWHMSADDALRVAVVEQVSGDFTEAGQALAAGRPPQWKGTDMNRRRIRKRQPAATSGITELHHALVARVLHGEGRAPTEVRRAAFDDVGLDEPTRTLVEKVCYRAHLITDEDVSALRTAGRSEDEVFEIVVCAAIGQATRQFQGALAALATATKAGGL